MKILVYVELKDGAPLGASLELLSAAAALGAPADAVLVGEKLDPAAAKTARSGAASVTALSAQEPLTEDFLTACLADCAADANLVLMAATTLGKALAPRLAARLGGGSVNDAIELRIQDGVLTALRPVYAGALRETVAVTAPKAVVSVRGGSYPKPAETETVTVTHREAKPEKALLKTVITDIIAETGERVNLEEAKVVVSGGRGMGDADGFALCGQLAAALGGVVGATRPAVENGWISRTHQVGQSGKIVQPDLYIACGLSGSAQHISGMIGSRYIVAVNRDPDAPIFRIADLGIVGDVKKILPLLTEAVKAKKAEG